MCFGAVARFQVLFKVHITPASTTERLARYAQLPKYNYLAAQWLHSPYRNQIHYSVDPQNLQFAQNTVDSYQPTIQFIAVVYDDEGDIVNSFINTVRIDVSVEEYSRIMQDGLGNRLPIAIPANGDFYLRLGVHDLTSHRVGALEVPVESIKPNPQTSQLPRRLTEAGGTLPSLVVRCTADGWKWSPY